MFSLVLNLKIWNLYKDGRTSNTDLLKKRQERNDCQRKPLALNLRGLMDKRRKNIHSREYVECVYKRLSMGISIHSLEHNVNNSYKSI